MAVWAYLNKDDLNEPIFNLWSNVSLMDLFNDFGINQTNLEGLGTLEIDYEGLNNFKELNDNLSNEDINILNFIEEELKSSSNNYLQFECW